MNGNVSPQRRRSIEVHIKNGDYFGTLATVLDLMRQSLGRSARERRIAATLKNYVGDLLYLQEKYELKAKPKQET